VDVVLDRRKKKCRIHRDNHVDMEFFVCGNENYNLEGHVPCEYQKVLYTSQLMLQFMMVLREVELNPVQYGEIMWCSLRYQSVMNVLYCIQWRLSATGVDAGVPGDRCVQVPSQINHTLR